ncbi:hypothetical protein VTH06DRAFT_7511 [Thermothelomyces fergusii]
MLFTYRPDKKGALYYFGFYADDWFHAVYAMFFFGERRRKIIDVLGGNYRPTSRFTVYIGSAVDSTRIRDDYDDPEYVW